MKASILWPGIIVTILGANVGIVGLTVAVSRAGGGYVVEEGYDRKALKWDEHKAKLEKQMELGWGVGCEVASATSGKGSLRVRVTDRDGKPVANARVRVSAFQAGWPNEARPSAVVVTDDDGVAVCEFSPMREGKWIVDVSASHGGDVFEARLERDVWFDVAAAQKE
ncbi:MAG TPA: FixH family protein [Phycisphaerales bacterium]|nr:FixH family protein [Phycisphaerales bacterium]